MSFTYAKIELVKNARIFQEILIRILEPCLGGLTQSDASTFHELFTTALTLGHKDILAVRCSLSTPSRGELPVPFNTWFHGLERICPQTGSRLVEPRCTVHRYAQRCVATSVAVSRICPSTELSAPQCGLKILGCKWTAVQCGRPSDGTLRCRQIYESISWAWWRATCGVFSPQPEPHK